MKSDVQKCQVAFTLIEIMIVVSLIGMLAVLAMPSFVKVRQQSQGRRIVNDARVIDTAIDSWAIEHNMTDGDDVNLGQAGQYTKAGTIKTNDVLGNSYGIGKVGTNQVRIADQTKSALSKVPIDWGAY